jgi:hypothetical protein
MGEGKLMHDAKWVAAGLDGQRTQFADQGQ